MPCRAKPIAGVKEPLIPNASPGPALFHSRKPHSTPSEGKCIVDSFYRQLWKFVETRVLSTIFLWISLWIVWISNVDIA
ncbi:hypothetical protein J2S03_001920 [Alicyclobacillus cycloheptanicus]|uniref:Uncharacterized protein n=1 Tax=Alicyclobacillus cycloheptanicus TaxID=1457 RepID=A0ABT9XIC0_9BACL|nr:hypothetical protein [Alicyclobacillus cycloheptanicus]